MVGAALEALVGGAPADEALDAALATIPPDALPDTLRRFARAHGVAALPVLDRLLATGHSRPAGATAAAAALGAIPAPEAAALLVAAEARAPARPLRTALRRALYQLRQAGVSAPAPARTRPGPPGPRPQQAWMSAIDGTGTRGVWLVLESPDGGRTLVTVLVNDQAGVLDGAAGPITRKRLDAQRAALTADSALPWVEVPAARAAAVLAEARARSRAAGAALPGDLGRWLDGLPSGAPDPVSDADAPGTDPAAATDPQAAAALLALPELASWFFDPPAVQTEALERLQGQESRLVVSDQIKAEREAALLDRVLDRELTPEARRLWSRRLAETAAFLTATARPDAARAAAATAQALTDPAREPRHLPFLRGLAERSLAIAAEVALGRMPAAEVSRQPRRPS